MTPLHALFQQRIEGDDALLQLARVRFEQAGLAAEVYAGSGPELERILGFTPPDARPPTVHLPRDLDLLDPGAASWLAGLAARFGDRVSGFVVHDRRHLPDRLPELTATAVGLSATLVGAGPAWLFVEYAAGLPPERFVAIGEALRDVDRVGLAIDTGHVGIRQARREFARRRPADPRDIAALSADEADLPALVDDVQAAVESGLDVVVDLIRALAGQAKPVHFHLHDGHPLVPGLSDHFGFLSRVPVPFRYRGMSSLAPLYGVPGLGRIVRTVAETLGARRSSFTLEIHEHEGRLPLAPEEVAGMFGRWHDLSQAERMNFWLRELAENASLVRTFAGS
jgi:hypothetical protein